MLPDLLDCETVFTTVLDEVSEAVRVEQRSSSRAVELHIDAVEPVSSAVAHVGHTELWRLEVTLPASRRRLRSVEGAVLIRDIADSGLPWGAEVVEADIDGGELVIATEPGAEPELGRVRLLPFNFLRPLQRLVEAPAMAGARPSYARLLLAATGRTRARHALPPGTLGAARSRHGSPAWTWPWAMVWGPPGTGKTHTLVQEVARILQDPAERVLVVSTTNKATDEVALRLGPQPGGVLRVGSLRVDRFRDQGLLDLLPRPSARLDRIQAAEDALAAASTTRARAVARLRLAKAREGLPHLRELLADQWPRCVLTTAHAAVSAVTSSEMEPFLAERRAPFTTLVVDEAGLISRAVVAAMGLLAARQVVLIGDPRQLSPICEAERSMAPDVKRWLAQSAMEHAEMKQPETQALMFQHRMHPAISDTVSDFQYGGRLQSAHTVRGRPLPAPLQGRASGWPRAAWVVLDHSAGMDLHAVAAERGSRGSWQRPAGLEILRRLGQQYSELGQVSGLFISPYRAQAAGAGRVFDALGWGRHWTASTVHAQQGSQADVVVFDLVRVGGWSVPEWKRLVNVALSRARHQLFVLAASHELDRRAGCGALLQHLSRCSVDEAGVLRAASSSTAQQTLLGRMATTVDPLDPPTPSAVAADRPRRLPATGPGPGMEPPSGDPAHLGTQIFHSRAARRSMTLHQARIVGRGLRDLGPRLVRGVAGSGKTVVLARWAAVELLRHPQRQATIVFGNTALRSHLARLLEQSWRVTTGREDAEVPWERVGLVHVGQLLRALLPEAGLPQPTGSAEYDYERLAGSLRKHALAPRFDLLYLDEAQDLGHETLALLVDLVTPVRDATDPERTLRPVRVFYDNAQNVYRRTTPRWSEFGLDMRGRSTVLRESFRATRPTMEFALDVVDRLRSLDEDPDLRELMSPRHGPPLLTRHPDGGWNARYCVVDGQQPDVELHADRAAELDALLRRVRMWVDQGVSARDIRVLAPRKQLCRQIETALRAGGVDAVHTRNTRFDNGEPRVVVTTPQSFKGYEAEIVAVVGVDGFVSRREDGALVEALYVALTRARTWMWVSGVRVPADHLGAQVVGAVERAAALMKGECPAPAPED